MYGTRPRRAPAENNSRLPVTYRRAWEGGAGVGAGLAELGDRMRTIKAAILLYLAFAGFLIAAVIVGWLIGRAIG